jgi:hypothetical protein
MLFSVEGLSQVWTNCQCRHGQIEGGGSESKEICIERNLHLKWGVEPGQPIAESVVAVSPTSRNMVLGHWFLVPES